MMLPGLWEFAGLIGSALLGGAVTYFYAHRQFRSEKRLERQLQAFHEVFVALKDIKLHLMKRDHRGQATYGEPQFMTLFRHAERVLEIERDFLPHRSWDRSTTLCHLIEDAVNENLMIGGNGGKHEYNYITLIDEYLAELAEDMEMPYRERSRRA